MGRSPPGNLRLSIHVRRWAPPGTVALGLNGAEIVLIPSATSRGLSEYLWRIEQPSHAIANGYYVTSTTRATRVARWWVAPTWSCRAAR